MKKMLVAAIACAAIGMTGCQKGAGSGMTFRVERGKPYVDYQDLVSRKLPNDGFLMTGYRLESDNTLELSFYTHGKPEDKTLIDPTIESVKYLTQNLNKQYPIRVVFFDGNPMMKVNGQTVGTGEVIQDVSLPITQ